jgi:hypothetical protein
VATPRRLRHRAGGRRLARTLAQFVDASLAGADYRARIAWSDGPVTTGIVVADGKTFDVRGTRRFTRPGRLHVSVTFTSGDGRTSVARSVVIVRRR